MIRSVWSADVDDLGRWQPEAPGWSLPLRLIVGPSDGPGDESFDVTVCDAAWLEARAEADGVFDARHHLVVPGFDWHRVRGYLDRRVSACHGADWSAVAMQLSRLGHWEFEDYRE